jgi:hypothetical protein
MKERTHTRPAGVQSDLCVARNLYVSGDLSVLTDDPRDLCVSVENSRKLNPSADNVKNLYVYLLTNQEAACAFQLIILGTSCFT